MHEIRNNKRLFFYLLVLLIVCLTIMPSFPASLNATELNEIKDPAIKELNNYNSPLLMSPLDVKQKSEMDDISNNLVFESENINPMNYANITYPTNSYINNFPIRNKSGLYIAGFSSKSGKNLLRFSYGGASLLLSPSESVSVTGKVYQNTISYKDIYPYTEFRYTVEKSYLKEDIIVQKYTGKSDFHFKVDISNVLYKKKYNGEIHFFDPSSDNPLFYMPKPYALDKNSNRCDLVNVELSKAGLLTVSVDPEWLKKAVYPVIIDPTFILLNATFSRSSVAYEQDGSQVAVNQPRYEAGKFGQALMVEEGTTNLLTANQSSLEDSLPTGFVGDGGFVTWSTSTSKSGSACMRIDTNTTDVWGGADLWNNGAGFTVTPGTTYTFSIFAKGVSGGENILIQPYKSDWSGALAGSTSAILTSGTWTRITSTFTVPSGCNSVFFLIRKNNVSTPLAWYMDCLQLEQKEYATSWNIGGTTRARETLTIPTAGVFTKGSWAVELVFTPTSKQNRGIWDRIFELQIDNDNTYRILSDINGHLALHVESGGIYYTITDNTILNTGQPYSIMVTGNGSVICLYKDGVQIGSDTTYVEPVGVLPANINIGSDSSGSWQPNGLIDDLRISNRPRTLAEHQAAYNSGQLLPIDEATTCKMDFNANLQITSYCMINTGITTSFNRSSVAYKQDGSQVAVNQPRYEAGKFGQALMVEEGTTNLLTANQSSLEDSLPTGFVGDGGFVTWSTSTSKSGSACMRIDTNTTDVWGGADLWNNEAGFTVTPGTTYTFSIFAKGVSGGENILIQPYKSDWSGAIAGSTSAILTSGTWTRITSTFTVPSGCNSVFFLIRKNNVSTPLAWYMDCLQLEQKEYATSWNIGGTTRARETLTIPTAGVFTKGSWAVELVFTPTSKQNRGIWDRIFELQIDNDNTYRILSDINGHLALHVESGGIYYTITDNTILNTGQPYSIMVTGNGSVICLYKDGVQIGSDTTYVEPVGVLPANINIGSDSSGSWQPNGLIDDLRISNRPRTLAEHQAAYLSNQPLSVDRATTIKVTFDNDSGTYAPVINYVYDNLNHLNTMFTSEKTVNYQYDGNGNVIRRTIK